MAEPPGPCLVEQTWTDILFAHWPIEPRKLRALLPEGLELDTHQGTGWLGVTPLHAGDLRGPGLPTLPWLTDFDEVSVRTYVTCNDEPGVYFFSLDLDSALTAMAGRAATGLPYHGAKISRTPYGPETVISTHRHGGQARFLARYQPEGPVYQSQEGSLEHWLTERYRVFFEGRGRMYKVELRHFAWDLQEASLELFESGLVNLAGVVLPGTPAVAHLSSHQTARIWAPQPLDR